MDHGYTETEQLRVVKKQYVRVGSAIVNRCCNSCSRVPLSWYSVHMLKNRLYMLTVQSVKAN